MATHSKHLSKIAVICICGDRLNLFAATELMSKYGCDYVVCEICSQTFNDKDDILFACHKLGNSKFHPHGYGFCDKCGNILYEEESHNDHNPQFYELCQQRLIYKMDYIKQNREVIGLDSMGLLTRLLHKQISDFYYCNKKKHFMDKEKYEKQVGVFAFEVLDIQNQYKWVESEMSNIDYNDQEYINKLCNFCTLYCYIIMKC